MVQGAKVTVSGAAGTKTDTTNQDGQFLFPLLTPGFYSLKVEKGSFKTADAKGIEVVTGRTSNVRVGLIAGQQTEIGGSFRQRHHRGYVFHLGRR